jgi:hypothetical protein
MDTVHLRSWWFSRQGFGHPHCGDTSKILGRAGWARSVGGAGPYLTLHSRSGAGSEEVDRDVKELRIHELPSARNCTYIVPASDFALALQVGKAFSEGEMNVARKIGVTDREIEKLCRRILDELGNRTLAPEEIREAVGTAARSLGDEGKRKGLTTTLPIALGRLQTAGEIRRVPVNGRLDQQRYAYVRWTPNPLTTCVPSREDAYTELARRYFAWIGPATPAEFQWFSGLGVKAAKAAMAPLGLVPMVEGSDRLMHAADRQQLEEFRSPREPHYALVSSLDSMLLLRRDLRSLIDPADANRTVPAEKGSAALGGLADVPSHAILDRGRLIGLWEYDAETETIAWLSFVRANSELKKAVEETADWIRRDLGDARSFSLDSPKSRGPRIAALRAAAAG